jgi:uncharacterized protein (TIGR02231 family)
MLSLGQKSVEANLSNITLYLDGAKIERNLSMKLIAGSQKIIITNLSEKLENESVRVNSKSAVKVLSVTTRENYLTKTADGMMLKEVQDSISFLTRQNKDLEDRMDALLAERNILEVNQKLSVQDVTSVENLKDFANYFGKRILELNRSATKMEVSLQRNAGAISKFRNHLSSNQNVKTKAFKEIVLVVKSNSSQTVNFNIEYLVNSAGWVPTYDLRVSELSKPIVLEYKSQVYNNTGVNWEGVNFFLSTADPRKSASKPTLKSWVIKNNNYEKDFGNIGGASYDNNNKSVTKDGIEYEEISIPELSMEFKIEDQYAIPSDAKPYLVEVTEFELNASYKHYAVPKVEQAVFLLARISGWEDLNLIEGNANIYFGGSYVGESYIKTTGVSDTLDISLGRDNKVSIERVKTKDYTDNKVLGSSRKDILEFEMVVKNLRNAPVEVEIQDQVPISGDDDIVIDVVNVDGANHDLKSGILTWTVIAESGKSLKKDLSFSIKYPKHMSISKQKSMKAVRAKF